MAHYTSLWTSAHDKEFKVMSKIHLLERRRLRLTMTDIKAEHAQEMERLRVDKRELGTLVHQYETEKETRARRLLKSFKKVQKKRRATNEWKLIARRANEVTSPSTTFDVEIGSEDAPWGGGRRKSSTISLNSFRSWGQNRSRAPSLASVSTTAVKGSPRGSLNQQPQQPPKPKTRLTVVLPPLGNKSPPNSPLPSDTDFLGFLAVLRANRQGRQTDEGQPDENVTNATSEDSNGNTKGRRRSQALPRLKLGFSEDEKESKVKVKRFKNQIFWTETFPYVHHVAGQLTCPRYDKLFHESKQYSTQTKKNDKRRKSRKSVVGLQLPQDDEEESIVPKPTFKNIAKTVKSVQALTSNFAAFRSSI